MPMTSGIVRALRRGQAKIVLVTGRSFWWPADGLRYGQQVFVAWNHFTDKPASVHGKEVVQHEYDGPGPATPLPPASVANEQLFEEV